MKTQINIGDLVTVSGNKCVYTGVVKGKHLFSYDILSTCERVWEDLCGDYHRDVYSQIKRVPKHKVFWASDNDKIIYGLEERENEDD